MDLEVVGSDGANLKTLIHNIRSLDDAERKLTINQIPNLILESLKHKNAILNQLLLVIYNLNTTSNIYQSLNDNNRSLIIRNLLRLYIETIQEPQHKQIIALTETINFVHSSDLLVELAYVLHKCLEKLPTKEDCELVEEALSAVEEKAAANLHPEALLMIHSIKAIK